MQQVQHLLESHWCRKTDLQLLSSIFCFHIFTFIVDFKWFILACVPGCKSLCSYSIKDAKIDCIDIFHTFATIENTHPHNCRRFTITFSHGATTVTCPLRFLFLTGVFRIQSPHNLHEEKTILISTRSAEKRKQFKNTEKNTAAHWGEKNQAAWSKQK